jgi:hypothetical protein
VGQAAGSVRPEGKGRGPASGNEPPSRAAGTRLNTLSVHAFLAATGFVGLLGADARVSTLVWLGLWAPAAGYLMGRLRPGRLGLAHTCLVLLAWFTLIAALPGGLRQALGASLSVGILCLGGRVLGLLCGRSRHPRWGWSGAALVLLLSGTLTALPSVGGALARPLTPELTARLMDLSPVVWVAENGGLDWMRHPSVYELAGAGDMGPELRLAHAAGIGTLVACGLLLMACGLLARPWRANVR